MYGDLRADEIERLLHSSVVGHLGCYGDGHPYVIPITYAYDGAHLYGYTREGMKLRLMRAHPAVCVQVDRITNVTEWQSVVASGTFEELHGDDADAARALLAGRFLPMLRGAPMERAHGMGGWANHPPSWQDAVIYRVRLTAKSGRFERP